MNDVEDRLRDALSTRAHLVAPDPRAYEGVLARRSRRRLRSWSAVTTATLAATGVAVIMAVSGGPARPPVTSPPATAPPTPVPSGVAAPERFGAVVDGRPGVYRTDSRSNVFSVSHDGATTGTIAAVGDGERFYFSTSVPDSCASHLRIIEDTDTSGTTRAPRGNPRIDARITEMAVSPDGQRLAYAAKTGKECAQTVLRVRDLTTGAERTWPDLTEPDESGDTFALWLSWAPDSRYLAYTADLCCDGAQGFRVLDTDAPVTSFLDPPLRGESVPDPAGAGTPCRLVAPAYRGTTGQLVAVRDCIGETETFTAVVVDPDSGDVLRDLFAITGEAQVHRLEFDASGANALVERGDGNDPTGLDTWTGGPAAVDAGGERIGYAGVSW